jgi:hypothetical protein
MKSRIAILILGVAALLMILPAGASASSASSSVTVSKYSLGFFYGKVKSENKACRKKRKVTLYTHPGAPDPDAVVGGDKTTKKGKWTINDTHGLGGEYYATVNEKTIKAKAKKVTCESATSPIFSR